MSRLILRFEQFGWDAVADASARYGLGIDELISAACRRVVADPGSAPPVLDSGRPSSAGEQREVTLDLSRVEWEAIEQEATRREIEPTDLIRHATLLLIADFDSGRIAREIADNDQDEDDRDADDVEGAATRCEQ